MTSTTSPEPIDRSTVNLNGTYEVAYWMRKLGLSENELFNAVATAGKDIQAVRAYIHRSRLTSMPLR
jgi:hypothetical protein